MGFEEHRRGLEAGKPWAVQIDVYLDDDSGPKPQFRVMSCLQSYENDCGDTYVVFENKCRPGFEIIFQLHDLTGKGYTFPKDADDAVWSKMGDDCPDEAWSKDKRYAESRVFTPLRVMQPDQLSLVVKNDNEKKADGNPIGRFKYTLNVGKGGAKPYLPLDPGGAERPARLHSQ